MVWSAVRGDRIDGKAADPGAEFEGLEMPDWGESSSETTAAAESESDEDALESML
jgi:hypothetical protein